MTVISILATVNRLLTCTLYTHDKHHITIPHSDYSCRMLSLTN